MMTNRKPFSREVKRMLMIIVIFRNLTCLRFTSQTNCAKNFVHHCLNCLLPGLHDLFLNTEFHKMKAECLSKTGISVIFLKKAHQSLLNGLQQGAALLLTTKNSFQDGLSINCARTLS